MKLMTCRQLGGACDVELRAQTFEEMAELSKKHAMQMHQIQDPAHLEAMQTMQALMQEPEEMKKWFDSRRKEFANLPES